MHLQYRNRKEENGGEISSEKILMKIIYSDKKDAVLSITREDM